MFFCSALLRVAIEHQTPLAQGFSLPLNKIKRWRTYCFAYRYFFKHRIININKEALYTDHD
jgi:hypothetical protein